jgi:hypothetical protein
MYQRRSPETMAAAAPAAAVAAAVAAGSPLVLLDSPVLTPVDVDADGSHSHTLTSLSRLNEIGALGDSALMLPPGAAVGGRSVERRRANRQKLDNDADASNGHSMSFMSDSSDTLDDSMLLLRLGSSKGAGNNYGYGDSDGYDGVNGRSLRSLDSSGAFSDSDAFLMKLGSSTAASPVGRGRL